MACSKARDQLGSGENAPLFPHCAGWGLGSEWRLSTLLRLGHCSWEARLAPSKRQFIRKLLYFLFLSCSGAETPLLHRLNLLPLALCGGDTLPKCFHLRHLLNCFRRVDPQPWVKQSARRARESVPFQLEAEKPPVIRAHWASRGEYSILQACS